MLTHLHRYLADYPGPAARLRLFSPGRINLIGEHVDYTGGWVMPAAIDKGIEFYARPYAGEGLRLHAVDLGERHDLPLPVGGRTGRLWVDYLAGIVDQFARRGHTPPPLEIFFGGNVPRGAGLSSSAALEGGMAFLLNEITAAALSRPDLARLCQRSSNDFMGVPSGIMDQFASLNGTAAGPILLSCHDHSFTPLSADVGGHRWLLVDSCVTHELAGGEYGVRVSECAAALAAVQRRFPGVSYLSATTAEQLAVAAPDMDPTVRKRARHVVSENDRVHRMATALEAGDAVRIGDLLSRSHTSLAEDYAVSCPEVDFLQRTAVSDFPDAVRGARIMGGGFGGCTLNLVTEDAADRLRDHLTAAYARAFGKTPVFHDVRISRGTHLLGED